MSTRLNRSIPPRFFALTGVCFAEGHSAAGAFYVPSGLGQATSNPNVQASMPSDSEVQDLLKKADEKVAAFKEAVNAAKIHLDKINPKLSANYLDAASAAHDRIAKTQKNGASSYGLVAPV